MAMAMDMDTDIDLGVRTRTPDSNTSTPPHPTRHVSNIPVSYKECMKNHAATIGGHALDGCCEFMPTSAFNPTNPTSLKCGACGCHRNFHRRDPDDPTPLNHHPTLARVAHSPPTPSQLLLSLSRSPSGPSPSDEVNPIPARIPSACVVTQGVNGHNFSSGHSNSSRKRFRTKFTQEQKEKMHEFSEKIGWKLKKGDEKLIEDFVKEIGVGRSVFKVWMHNNKHNSTPKNNNNSGTGLVSGIVTLNVVSSVVKSETNVNYPLVGSNNNGNGNSNSNSSSNNNNNNNCGASAFDNHNHNLNHRQFNFGNGGGQEATQAQ